MPAERQCGVCWTLLVLVVLAVAFTAYRLLTGAHTHDASDGRAEITLSAADRDLVLAEMRGFLVSVQGITDALTRDDMQAVASHARAVGLAAMGQVPASLMQALPLEFKQLGRSVHAGFDQLALDAEQMGDSAQGLKQLGDILGTCVACHATYRISAGVPTQGGG